MLQDFPKNWLSFLKNHDLKKQLLSIEARLEEEIKLGKIIDFSLIPDEVYIANKIPKTNNGKTLYQKIRTNIKNKNFKKLI